MIIFALDDEKAMLEELVESIREAEPNAEVYDYPLALDALRAIKEKKIMPDVVFSDIEMPGMNGLSLAAQIKQLVPAAKIVFVTGYSHFAVEAYRKRINGYVLKPVDAAQIREELDYLQQPYQPALGKLQVRCFGYFEVFCRGNPVEFGRKQSKELFAYLIDHNSICSSGEIASAIWEGESDVAAYKARLRSLVYDLRNTLSTIGFEDVILRKRDQIGLQTSRIDCDYYRFLAGDTQAINAFRGEYMSQYSWAEATIGKLMFRNENE